MTDQDPLERIKREAAKAAADRVMADVIPLMTRQAAEKAARSVVTQRDYQAGIERGLRIWLAGRSAPASPRFAGRLAIYNPTPATIAAARAAGVMVDYTGAIADLDRRASHYERMGKEGHASPAVALRTQRRALEAKAKLLKIRVPTVFGSDADAVSWLRARLSTHIDGGDAA